MRAWLVLGVLLVGCDGDVTSDSASDDTGGSSADGGQAAVGGSTAEAGTGGTSSGGTETSTGGSAGDDASGGAAPNTGGALGNAGGTGASTGGDTGHTGGTGSGGDTATGGSVASGGNGGSGGAAQSCDELREQFMGIYEAHLPEARACTQDEECAYVSFAHDCGQICPNAINVQYAHLIGTPLYSFSAASCGTCWEGHDALCSQPPDAKCENGLCTFVSAYPEGGQLVE